MAGVSIIIVNYKNQKLILGCVRSIIENEPDLDYEVIVVDNHSEDNTESELRTILPELKWVQMGYNSGFGRANNVGMKLASKEYMLLLNSDVLMTEKNTLSKCLTHHSTLPNSDKMILGTRLVNTDGSYQETLRLHFPGLKKEIRANAFYILFFDRILKKNKNSRDKTKQKEEHFRSGEVAWINGAFLLMNRSQILNKDLFFDEDFFLYSEDTEWCWRASKRGMKFYHWHEQELIHIGSASSNNQKERFQQILASDWLYLRKTRGFFYALINMTMIWKNQVLDSILHFFANLRRKSFSESEIQQQKRRKWTYENLKRFYFPILFSKKLSEDKSFKVNCYENN